MIGNLIDVISSLTLIMREETERLTNRTGGRDLAELATVKMRLVGMLETAMARMEREQAQWADTIEEAVHERLLEALLALGEASAANAAVLERQIDLSVELIGAISTEAKRIAGRSTTTYGAQGDLSSFEAAIPIAVNSKY